MVTWKDYKCNKVLRNYVFSSPDCINYNVALRNSYRWMYHWRTLSKISGITLIWSAATTIIVTTSSALCTFDKHINDFMCPQKKKFSGLRSGNRAGQVTGSPHPIHRREYVTTRKCWTSAVMWFCTLLCMKHICVCIMNELAEIN